MLAGLAAILVLLDRRTMLRVALAGGCCGLSASFTQTRGFAALVGFAVYLLWEGWTRRQGWRSTLKRQAVLLAGALGVFLTINGYFIWKAGPARYFWCTVVFVLKYYPKEADFNTFAAFKLFLPTLAFSRGGIYDVLSWLFWFVLSPCTYIAFFIRYWRNACRFPHEYWARPMIVAIVGLFMVLSVAPSPTPERMSISILPALILVVWLLNEKDNVRPSVLAAAFALVVFAGFLDVRHHPRKAIGFVTTPQGVLAICEPAAYNVNSVYDEYKWVLEHTHAGDYFYEAGYPDMYFYLGLRNPTPLPYVVNNGYTTADQVEEVIRQLGEHKPRFIFWSIGDPLVVPAWERPTDAHLQPLLDYIHSNYTLAKVFSGTSDLIWERKPQ